MRNVRRSPGVRVAALILLIACVVLLSLLAVSRLPLSLVVRFRPRSADYFLSGLDDTMDRPRTVSALHEALQRKEYERASFLNSLLAQEAFGRSFRVLKAWERVRDKETGLVPEALRPDRPYWSTHNAAADLFPFLLLASHYVDRARLDTWIEAIAAEREFCGPMPRSIDFEPARFRTRLEKSVVSGASEYAKDGLLAVTERLGEGLWLERMEEVMGAIIDTAHVETSRGNICSSDCEVNGEMLQTLCRLYWLRGRREYLEMAERIGRAYLLDALPANGYLPCEYWDFTENRPVVPEVRLRDHGSEIIVGLVELYFLERMKGRAEADSFRAPLMKLLDVVLRAGRTGDGLWHSRIDTTSHQILDARIIDTWGYLLSAYKTFDLAEGSDIYGLEIRRTMLAAASRRSFLWEGETADGYADTIESMLYMLPWFDIPVCHRWVDEEIAIMFGKQKRSGFIDQRYLDGNFIRTSLMYARYKTQGIIPEPWREDLRLGAARDKRTGVLYVYVGADAPWEGVLEFDSPRHRTIWRLPLEYPRVNGEPEWFTASPQAAYRVTDLLTGRTERQGGRALSRGMPVLLDETSLCSFLMVTMERGD